MYTFSPFRLIRKSNKVLAHVTKLWFFMETFSSLNVSVQKVKGWGALQPRYLLLLVLNHHALLKIHLWLPGTLAGIACLSLRDSIRRTVRIPEEMRLIKSQVQVLRSSLGFKAFSPHVRKFRLMMQSE